MTKQAESGLVMKVHVGSFGVAVNSRNDMIVLDEPVRLGVPMQVQFQVVPIAVYQFGNRYTVEVHLVASKARFVPGAIEEVVIKESLEKQETHHRFIGLDIDE